MTLINVNLKVKINALSESEAIDIITLLLEDNNIQVKRIYTDNITEVK